MKLPRDVSGEALARLLKKVGYEITRQKGSHVRLTQPSNLVSIILQFLTITQLKSAHFLPFWLR